MRVPSIATRLAVAAAFAVSAGGAAAQSGRPIAQLKKAYERPMLPPFPADNPYSAEKADLGKMLFFDPRLSGNNYISCASCHNPSLSYGDGLPLGIGHGMTVLKRKTPTILNTAWAELLMWDGRKSSLEEQALGPITADVEMNQPAERLVEKLAAIPQYRSAFDRVFPKEGVTLDTIAKSIATFERTVISGIAPFDRWIAGDEGAITDSAKRGFVVFNEKGNCAACHSGWNFTDGSFHDIGMPDEDIGRGKFVPPQKAQHAFKTPTLRDADRRGPYMHNGSLKTLRDVIVHYNDGFVRRPSLSDDMKPLGLGDAEIDDLLAFLGTLTGEDSGMRVPVLPPNPPTAALPTKRASNP